MVETRGDRVRLGARRIMLHPHTGEKMKLLWQAKMSSIQDWGEEAEEGAVYHVTLKRVQIQQAANKGARWLGVSKAGETVSLGLAGPLAL